MRSPALAALLAPFAILPLYSQTKQPAPQHPITRTSAATAPTHASSLPVTRVSLYKNGVGFFEHTGRVTGNADVTIDFTTAQLNDVLQSLTALDLNGGRISGAGYNSTTPLEQQLKSLPLALSSDTTAADFYTAIRGARVEAHAPGAAITGRLLSVEERTTPAKDDNASPITRHFLTIVSDSGEVRTLKLTPATSVRLLDTDLHTDVSRYLKLLADNRSQGLRHLTLTDSGTGPRELRVSYISEVPIWKSTYRILFTDTKDSAKSATLQGWAVVDNTVGEDWNNVHLSLIAGSPQSFIQPLSNPIYSRRPEIPIAQEAQLTPQTFESSLDSVTATAPGRTINGTILDQSGATIPNAEVTATNFATGARTTGHTSADGTFNLSVPDPGNYSVQVTSPGFQSVIASAKVAEERGSNLRLTLPVGTAAQTVNVNSEPMAAAKATRGHIPGIAGMSGSAGGVVGGMMGSGSPAPASPMMYEQLAATSLRTNTSTSAFDDFFEYKISDPITIHKNESALVPILQSKIDADRVTLVTSNGYATQQPLRALWVRNTTGLTLDRGSFSIVENGNFGGEGLLEPIHPNERRLLSYAADQAVHVSTDNHKNSSHILSISAAKGVLTIRRGETRELTYVIHNAATDPRTVVIEHPVEQNFTLDPDSKPEESTPTVHRFRVHVAPGETARLHIGGKRVSPAVFHLTQSDDNQLTYILNSSDHNPALERALAPILEARRRVGEAQTAVNQTNNRLNQLRAEEERQRANITALSATDKSSGKGAAARFIHDLNTTEDAITTANADLTTRTTALEAARTELATRIEQLQLDETL